jgi:hypothetical protein
LSSVPPLNRLPVPRLQIGKVIVKAINEYFAEVETVYYFMSGTVTEFIPDTAEKQQIVIKRANCQ